MPGPPTASRATLVVCGQVVVRAGAAGIERAEAVGIADGRIVSVGDRRAVLDAAEPGAHVIDAADSAVVPGLNDAHLHLVGMARATREVRLDDARTGAEVTRRLTDAAAAGEGWLRGRGWREGLLDPRRLNRHPALRERPALVHSHDSHSLWASPAALAAAGMGPETPHPAGGRIERDADGTLSGILRERACEPVEAIAGRVDGAELAAALDAALAELAGYGVTGATDAGDTSVEQGIGEHAALGDRASRLLEMRDRIDGRLRLAINVPADAIEAAAQLGLGSGRRIGQTTLRGGWAKVYADGALGSRTAAVYDAYTCGGGGHGILRLTPEELDDRVAAARRHGIGLAIHAIGDRAAAAVLDAIDRGAARTAPVADRLEHLQLLRATDRNRIATNGIVASVQPVHAASDRETVERCWAGRVEEAYAWRGLAEAGVQLAFGSDAPIESPNPWLGIYAAAHRRFPRDRVPDWHPEQALSVAQALAAYTLEPARALGVADEGHLAPGAHADLAVLDIDLDTLLRAGDDLPAARSTLTLVGGHEVHPA